jgi:hypothetical protein
MHLLTIDPTNGNATVIGPISDPTLGVDGLRFNSQGVLYGAAWDTVNSVGKLLTIDPSNGNVLSSLTLLGNGTPSARESLLVYWIFYMVRAGTAVATKILI